MNSVSEKTVVEYAKRVWEFSQWAGVAEVGSLEAGTLDLLLVEFFEEAYFRGKSHDTAEKLLAALQFNCEEVRLKRPTSVPRALRAAAGFKRLAPGHSRAPLPWLALLAVAGAAYAEGMQQMGLALIVQFVGYLRPSELLNLSRMSVIACEPNRVGASVSLLLAPWGLGQTGKTGEFDESVLLRRPELPAMTHALRAMARREPRSASMFRLSYREYTQHFHRLAQMTGVSVLDPHPYSIRHGGASHDFLVRRIGLSENKRQGRWRSDSSVRRYEKASLIAHELERLSQATRKYGERIEANLDAMIGGSWTAPRPVARMAFLLKRRMRRMLRGTNARQVFLELFSGSGGVRRALAERGHYGAIVVDIQQGFDVTHSRVKNLIRGWIRSQVVRGLWLGVPCTTWSNERRPALRSSVAPWGFSGLSEDQQRQVAVGNATMTAAISLMQERAAGGIPVVTENPQGSLIWKLPVFAKMAHDGAVQEVTLDFCAFGAPWRKSTRLWSAHCALKPLERRCGGTLGWCHMGKRHIRLSGRAPDGRLLTKIAEPYPRDFARLAAASLAAAADRLTRADV